MSCSVTQDPVGNGRLRGEHDLPSYPSTVRSLSAVRARRLVASSPLPSAQACPKRSRCSPNKNTKERNKRKNKRKRDPVRICQPFHPTGVRLPCRDLGPFVGLLVSCYSFMRWAPPDLDDDTWSGPPQCCDVRGRGRRFPYHRLPSYSPCGF